MYPNPNRRSGQAEDIVHYFNKNLCDIMRAAFRKAALKRTYERN